MKCPVHAVATVERPLSSSLRLRKLTTALREYLEARGLASMGQPASIVVDRSQLGPGYGMATAQSLAACELLAGEGLALEPIYTGKAMAALLADASRKRVRRALFWHTGRRGPLPRDDGWRERLPEALEQRLTRSFRGRTPGRREIILGTGAVALAWGLGARLFRYPQLAWTGQAISAREAQVLMAAAEALLPPLGPSPAVVAANVDRFLATFTDERRVQVRALLGLVEQLTPIGGRIERFSSLSPQGREAYLAGLASRGWAGALAVKSLRNLCLVGYYQEPATWNLLGYPGPWGDAAVPVTPCESFMASEGELP